MVRKAQKCITIQDILEKEENKATVSVCAIVVDTDATSSIVTKNGLSFKKDIKLKDHTNHIIKITLWGSDAEYFGERDQQLLQHVPVLFTKLKVERKTGYGTSLSLRLNTKYYIGDDIPDCYQEIVKNIKDKTEISGGDKETEKHPECTIKELQHMIDNNHSDIRQLEDNSDVFCKGLKRTIICTVIEITSD